MGWGDSVWFLVGFLEAFKRNKHLPLPGIALRIRLHYCVVHYK